MKSPRELALAACGGAMLDRTRTLTDLAERIEAEHNAVATALQSALAHAIACGELLIEAKRKLRHGQWLPRLKANCTVPERTARHYMWLAKNRDGLCDPKTATVLPISVRKALHILQTSWPWPGEGSGDHEFPEAEQRESWPRLAWNGFGKALKTVIQLPQLGPPAPRYIVKAYRAGKTPGLTPAALREVIVLLSSYVAALETEERAIAEREAAE